MEWKTLTLLTVGYFIYLVIGASVFYAIERPLEIQKCSEAKEYKNMLMNITKTNFTASPAQIEEFLQVMSNVFF